MKEKIKKILLTVVLFFAIMLPLTLIEATRGCCSWHGGVAYCDTSTGRYVCNDRTYSPTCRCIYIPPKPSKTELVKNEIEKAKPAYYRNPHWFRENLIWKLMDLLNVDIDFVAFYVYTMLPDVIR